MFRCRQLACQACRPISTESWVLWSATSLWVIDKPVKSPKRNRSWNNTVCGVKTGSKITNSNALLASSDRQVSPCFSQNTTNSARAPKRHPDVSRSHPVALHGRQNRKQSTRLILVYKLCWWALVGAGSLALVCPWSVHGLSSKTLCVFLRGRILLHTVSFQ